MKYNDVLTGNKYYIPVFLNLAQEISWNDIGILMNLINCERISKNISIRKLSRFTKCGERTVQRSIKKLKKLGLLDECGAVQYDRLNNLVKLCNDKAMQPNKENKKIEEHTPKEDTPKVERGLF